MGRCHSAIRRRSQQSSLPLVPWLKAWRGDQKTITEDIEGQDFRSHALLMGDIHQGGLQIAFQGNDHVGFSSMAESAKHEMG